MRFLQNVTEEEVIKAFLAAEATSPRFGKELARLRRGNMSDKELLAIWRGYPDQLLFNGFPHDVRWVRVMLEEVDFNRLKYINDADSDNYWVTLSGGTRLVKDGAAMVRSRVEIFHQPNDGFWEIAKCIKAGKSFPPVICVAQDVSSDAVILEGHARMTGYFLAYERIPFELEIFMGFSSNISQWKLY